LIISVQIVSFSSMCLQVFKLKVATNWKQHFVSLAVNEQENQNLSAFNKATSSDSSAEQRWETFWRTKSIWSSKRTLKRRSKHFTVWKILVKWDQADEQSHNSFFLEPVAKKTRACNKRPRVASGNKNARTTKMAGVSARLTRQLKMSQRQWRSRQRRW